MKVLLSGDFYDGHRFIDNINNTDYAPFSSLYSILNEADFSVLNWEFPIDNGNSLPIDKAGPNLKGYISSIDVVKEAGFNVCTLANNHILDQGEQCCVYTKRCLEERGIFTVGAGSNLNEASEILYLKKHNEVLAIINCCEHEFSIASNSRAGANPINPISQYYKILEAKQNSDYVLVVVHGGHEHFQLPSPRMKEIYHFYIDIGADVVINHHQHCYSGYEIYRGKPIFYGLGNLLFDNPSKRNSKWNEGFVVMVNFQKETSINYEIYPYAQCNDDAIVQLLNNSQKKKFDSDIKRLNDIICDDNLLKIKYMKWIESSSKDFLIIFQPYIHVLFRALYVRGLLPTFMDKRKKYHILGMLKCQSHLDRLIHMVNNISTRK